MVDRLRSLTPNTKITFTLAAIITCACSLLSAGWFAKGLLIDIRDELSALRSDVKALSRDRWTSRDMQDFATSLQITNSDVQRGNGRTGLTLPDVREIRLRNAEGH